MKKGVWVTVIFFLFLGYTSFSLIWTGMKYECEVCMVYNNKEICQKVKGMDKMETVMQGVNTACGGLANGRTENIDCSNTKPAKVTCKEQ